MITYITYKRFAGIVGVDPTGELCM